MNEVSTNKHLGLYLSNNCSWHEHIDYIKAKNMATYQHHEAPKI